MAQSGTSADPAKYMHTCACLPRHFQTLFSLHRPLGALPPESSPVLLLLSWPEARLWQSTNGHQSAKHNGTSNSRRQVRGAVHAQEDRGTIHAQGAPCKAATHVHIWDPACSLTSCSHVSPCTPHVLPMVSPLPRGCRHTSPLPLPHKPPIVHPNPSHGQIVAWLLFLGAETVPTPTPLTPAQIIFGLTPP